MFWMLILLNLFWAGSYPAVKVLLETMTPAWIAAWRFTGGALGLGLMMTIPAFRQTLMPRFPNTPKDIATATVIGGVGITIIYLLFFNGAKLTTATEATILTSVAPMYGMAFAWWWLKEPFPKSRRWGALIALCGAWLVVNQGVVPREFNAAKIGNLMILAGGVVEAAVIVLMKRLATRYSGMAVLWLEFLVAAPLLAVIAWTTEGAPVVKLALPQAMAGLYLVGICTLFNFSVWYWLMERAPIGAMSLSVFVQTPAAAVIAYLLLRERLHPTVWLGAGLVLAGVYLATHSLRKQGKAKRQPKPQGNQVESN